MGWRHRLFCLLFFHPLLLLLLLAFVLLRPFTWQSNGRSICHAIREREREIKNIYIFRIPELSFFYSQHPSFLVCFFLWTVGIYTTVSKRDRRPYFGSGRALSILLLGCASSSIRMFSRCVSDSLSFFLSDSQSLLSIPFILYIYFFFFYFYFYTYSAHSLLYRLR